MKQTRTRKLRRDAFGRDIATADDVRAFERRNDFRHSASQHAAMRFRSANMICDLVDLSETGAKIRILDGAVPNIDERVVLTLFD
ncbi:MAG: PilZ domain-containing protein, partial [Hyphomicrobium denitrificans]|nr:PilZ domain-containing protein [Hyphomicrobium denitrificans]